MFNYIKLSLLSKFKLLKIKNNKEFANKLNEIYLN